MKADPGFRKELKAYAIARQILAELDEFIHAETFNVEHPLNKKIASKVDALGKKLKNGYPDSQAMKAVAERLRFYGLEL